MREVELLQALEALAAELSIDVRYEALESAGGLCQYGGQMHLIIPRDLTALQRVHALADALARQSLDGVFVRPHVRDFLRNRADHNTT